MERINSLSTSFLLGPLSSTAEISNFGVEPMAEILDAGPSANNPLNSSLEANTGLFAANFTESGPLNASFMDFDAAEIRQIAADAGPEIDGKIEKIHLKLFLHSFSNKIACSVPRWRTT